jgi:hypothetical protein
MKLYTKVER